MKDLLLTETELSQFWEVNTDYWDIDGLLQSQIRKLANMGLGFYETDDNFPANNKFIPLREILEREIE